MACITGLDVPAFTLPQKMRVLIAYDHPAVRQALAQSMRAEPNIEVIGAATSGEEAVALAGRLRPNVVIMDGNMRGLSGVEATQRLATKFPNMRIIGFSLDCSGHWASRMLAAGAVACFDKACGLQPLLAAFRAGKPAARNGALKHSPA